jgi:branched-chain amino acid transport system substrate-binding protein
MKNTFKILFLAAIANFASFAGAADNRPELRILNPSPLSGLVKDTGTQQAQAIQKGLAYFSTNSKYKVVYKAVDDKFDPTVALQVIPEAVDTFNPHAVVGLFGTPNVQKLVETQFFEKYKIPMIGSRTGATSGVYNEYTHHLRASFADEIQTYMKTTAAGGSKKIGLLYVNSSFGAEGLAAVKDYTSKNLKPNDPILIDSASHPKDTTDVKVAVDQLMAQKIDSIILMTTTAPAREAIKQIYAASVLNNKSVRVLAISSIDPAGLQLSKLSIKDKRFWVAFSSVVPNYSDEFQTSKSVLNEYDDFLKVSGLVKSSTTLEGFLIAKTTMAAADKVVAPMTKEKLQAALSNLKIKLSVMHTMNFGQKRASNRVYFDYYEPETNKFVPM